MMINWLAIGCEATRLVIYTVSGALLSGFLYARYVQPDLMSALQEAMGTITKVSTLAGVKSAEYRNAKNIEKAVARDIIEQKIPELDALKMFLSPATWEEVQDTIDNNPEAILQLWDKYGHLLKGVGAQESETKYNF